MHQLIVWSFAACTIWACVHAEYVAVPSESITGTNTETCLLDQGSSLADASALLQLHTGKVLAGVQELDVDANKSGASEKQKEENDSGIVQDTAAVIPLLHSYATPLAGVLSLLLCAPCAAFALWLRSEGGDVAQQQHAFAHSAQLDFAKFWLMCVVIMCHLDLVLAPRNGPLKDVVLDLIHPWCTRTFALISGICSRRPKGMAEWCKDVILGLVAPTLAYCIVVYPLANKYVYGNWGEGTFAHTAVVNIYFAKPGACWYIIGLIMWKCWGAILAPLPTALRVGAALALSALGGYGSFDVFKMGPAIATFPLFVVGQILPWSSISVQFPSSPCTRLLGFVLLVSLFSVQASPLGQAFLQEIPRFGWTGPDLAHSPALYDGKRQGLHTTQEPFFWLRGLFRNVLELMKGLVFVIFWCPQSPNMFSNMGRHSIYPYLLHYPALMLSLRFVHFAPFVNPTLWLLQWFLMSCLLNVVLCSWPVRLVLGPLYEPMQWMQLVSKPDVVSHK